ncbi:PTS transporter subunit IIC [Evansella cellulosilytica]|uniref:Phosphotransferase system EIIC n=1 Tax=Evansella cellulosilytica (strain ATCC 21833 / DSM 2522 / FERM P-1141 / JCM 9156 / N-4) TaxID=649639 RepID=E6U183_EVAC2|nr:PTS sugar transporter subunit IIC [Evansella cellulosilytica]ADU31529.1 phosphotransferase system EIIC [Evansella cellulosilytica DSM 2522]
MKDFLSKKGVHISFKTYVIDALSFMALGLFSSLIIGLIMKTAGGELARIDWLAPRVGWLMEAGDLAMSLMGPAIGVAIAFGLKAPRLVLFSSVITGAAGAALGGPAGAFICALISTEVGKLVSQETKVDIIVTPLVTIIAGFIPAMFIGPTIANALVQFGSFIEWSTELQPFLMGILIAVFMGLALTAPISSAAIAVMLDLHGIAAGAAAVGCAAQMVGFAVASYRENKWAGLISLGIGTSMLQIGNIVKNPLILIPPTVTAAILGPFATVLFQLENNAAGAGMGTSGLVGPIMTMNVMGSSSYVLMSILVLYFLAPAIISLICSEVLRKTGMIKFGDMKINQS